jgi:hypothetical protein
MHRSKLPSVHFINSKHRFQKTFITDHITKRQVHNNGELPKYFIEDAHQGIISLALFERVQAELAVRNMKGKSADWRACYA